MDCLVGKAGTTRAARLEVLRTPTWMARLPSRNRILRSQGGRQATPIPKTGRKIDRNLTHSEVRPTTAGRVDMETSRAGAGSFASQAGKSLMGELEGSPPFDSSTASLKSIDAVALQGREGGGVGGRLGGIRRLLARIHSEAY